MLKCIKGIYMFDNFILGPIVLFNDEEIIKHQLKDLFNQNWLPLIIFRKGQMLEDIRRTLPYDQQPQLKGAIISFGVRQLYKV